MRTKKCMKCGAENLLKNKTCYNCGDRIGAGQALKAIFWVILIFIILMYFGYHRR
jgi:hypothetical protein